MARLRWTKLQDFCLRLGLLKALVAVMPPERRSLTRDDILRRLEKAFFGRADTSSLLYQRACAILGADLVELIPKAKRGTEFPTVADALLISSGLSSWGQPIDAGKVAKVVEWAQTVDLLGQGHQVTERALTLKRVMDAEAIGRFLSGERLAWNPFALSTKERIFFLYHLGECDQVTWDLAAAAGAYGRGYVITPEEARACTATAMRRFVASAEKSGGVPRVLELRSLRELTRTIEAELKPRPAGPERPARFESRSASSEQARKGRVSQKNADHQAIPRFELLTDLGIVEKPVEEGVRGTDLDQQRSSWKFRVTEFGDRLARALSSRHVVPVPDWHHTSFAHVLCDAGVGGPAEPRLASRPDAADLFLASYGSVERKAGYTPFEAVALHAMITAVANGTVVEIGAMHEVFREIKRTGALTGLVSFAKGNDVHDMFLHIRPDGHDAIRAFVRSELAR